MMCFLLPPAGQVESELLHTYSRVDSFDVLILCVRVAVLTAVTLTVPIVLFPVSHLGLPSGGRTSGEPGGRLSVLLTRHHF